MGGRTAMEFNYVRKKSVSGSVPDFGAIFMSNRSTKEECFKKKLFGLPPFYADFVKKVKVGMVLFLFEYEQRKLYGVFEATSDGAVNIVPHAYRSSGKQFSAQVRISTIWYCNPLSEHDFHDAIEDNYFAVKKFNFGLSRDQVHRLLWLFDSRKLRIEKTQSLFTESKATEQCCKSLSERRVMKKGRSIAHESISFSEEPESLKISSSSFTAELGDYIPLLSPDDSDSIETGLPFSENNEVESATFIGCKDLSESEMDPMPFLSDALNGGSFRQDVSPESGPCHQDIESSAIAVPLSNVHDCRLKEGAAHSESRGIDCQGHCDSDYNDDYPSVKGLYSDMSERPSVFSRLTLASKTIVQENQDNIRVDISVHKIMEKLQMRHDNWRKKTRKAKPSEHANGANTLKRRTSVFSRLTLASKAIVQEMEDNTQVDKKEHKIVQMLQHYQNHCNKMMGRT
ncbi:hypothetical protein L1049_019939 [Liquidambar formosana]|uniref:DCD domain-containing protein n=1 Tax=Liquidambar formosana TaxID=63359 RepID=A0AAP0S7I5_LIQFO